MRLESHTIGNINDPTENDIRMSFLDEEWGDVPGNVYSLYKGDGTSIHSISGTDMNNYSLSLRNNSSQAFQVCTNLLAQDQVMEYFVKFFLNDMSWIPSLNWKEERKRYLFGAVSNKLKSTFKKR